MLKALDHKNLVHYFGTFIFEESKYIVTEYLSLGSLHSLVKERWTILTEKDKLDMAIDAAQGMIYLGNVTNKYFSDFFFKCHRKLFTEILRYV
jgi:serine/threonine protein kinase